MALSLDIHEEAGHLTGSRDALDLCRYSLGAIGPEIQWGENLGRAGSIEWRSADKAMGPLGITEGTDELARVVDAVEFRGGGSGTLNWSRQKLACPA